MEHYIFLFSEKLDSQKKKNIPQTNEPVTLAVYVVKPSIKAVSVQEK
jgi:hypothetical protein